MDRLPPRSGFSAVECGIMLAFCVIWIEHFAMP